LEKRERGHNQGLPIVFKYPLLAQPAQERVKLRTSNFIRTFIGSIGTKAHIDRPTYIKAFIKKMTERINLTIKDKVHQYKNLANSKGTPENFQITHR